MRAVFSILDPLAENIAIFLVKLLKISAVKRLADLHGQLVVEVQVVHHRKMHANRLLGLDEVADIRPAVMLARRAVAALVEGAGVKGILLVEQVHLAVPGEEVAVTGIAAGHDAVEEVDTQVNSLKDVAGRADAHEIAGLVHRHVGLDSVDDAVHILGAAPTARPPMA